MKAKATKKVKKSFKIWLKILEDGTIFIEYADGGNLTIPATVTYFIDEQH